MTQKISYAFLEYAQHLSVLNIRLQELEQRAIATATAQEFLNKVGRKTK